MRLDRIAAIFSAVTSHIVMPHSPTRPVVPPVPGGTMGHWLGGGDGDGVGHRNPLRISSSLQDLPTYSRLDPEEGGGRRHELESDYARSMSNHELLGESGSSPPPPNSFKDKVSQYPALLLLSWKRISHIAVCALFALLLFFLSYACLAYFPGLWSRNASNYYVVLDCGSTGTRVNVYEWSVNPEVGSGHLPIVLRSLPAGKERKLWARRGRAYQRMETEPGFDKLVRNETALRAAMMPLLHWAEKQIPRHAHKSASLFLYATAGVRRLPSSDSDWLLAKAWTILKDSSFSCKRERVKIVSGMEEAYYGWIALNYHLDTLGAPRKTFGSLDLGGSSLQVTFETPEAMHDETGLRLSIGAVSQHLSAYSLPGYGLNDAFDKSVVYLLKQLPVDSSEGLRSGRIVLKHPCLQTGYKEPYHCSRCGLMVQDGGPVIGRTVEKGQNGISVKLVGAPKWEECSALAKATVNLSEWSDMSYGIDCNTQPCALDDKLPHPHGGFYAMSGFYVVFRFFNLSLDSSLDDMLQKGQEFCAKTWKVAKSSVTPQPFIEQYCFRSPYVASLLRDGLHIKDSQVIIGSGSITWTLGVALLEAGQAISQRGFSAYKMWPRNIKSLTVVFLVLPILLFCAVSFFSHRLRRFFRTAHLPLFRHNNASSPSFRNIPSPFRFYRWSPIISGDEREKMPLSPKVAGSDQRSFGLRHGLGGSSVQLVESSSRLSAASISRSYSGGFSEKQYEAGIGSFWLPRRNQMQLQSRRSQSREDLSSSLAEVHIIKN